ncbi:hypothetical protein [Nocardiopsis trehalosi]|uniref:hypothetical protein n=1 Tax=Nocardiopsis trehalosi TaxID=109329 RepID=UPI00082EEDED|nr:hypothetical protein [Nocardiopsis trehalosi]
MSAPTGRSGAAARRFVTAVVAVTALQTLAFGGWMLVSPPSFAAFAGFPPHTHFLHDLGAYHIGIGVALVMALVLRDALIAVLAGFAAGGSVHAVNHAVDAHLGGSPSDPYVLGGQAALALLALAVRVRQVRRREAARSRGAE